MIFFSIFNASFNGLKGVIIANLIIGLTVAAFIIIIPQYDVYDALTSQRVYKEAFSHKKSVDIIVSDREKHFDPDLVDIFLNINSQFDEIRKSVAE